jgi:O-antigen ligase
VQSLLFAFVIILFSKAFLPSLLTSGDRSVINPEEGLWQFQMLVGLAYGATAILAVRDARRMQRAALASWPLWLVGAVALASALWSIDPQITLRRSMALLGTTLLGVYAGSTIDAEGLRRSVRIAAWITIVGSGLMVLYTPDLGIHQDIHEGYWRGAFLHKNNLGEFAALAVVCFLLDCLATRKLALAPLIGIAICLWLLVGAGSRTAWVMTPILATLVLAFGGWEARKVLKVAAVVAVVALLISPSIDWSLVGALLERDESLTGRIPLWSLVWADIGERPVLGYGYGAYWLGKVGLSPLFWATLGWRDSPNQAHNGFLDVWLECGLLGVLALLATLLVFLRAPSSKVPSERAAEWSFGALVVGFGCVGGEFVIQNSVYWFLVTAVVTQRCLRTPEAAQECVHWRPLVQHAIPAARGVQ